jgi:hypothetical protein
MADARCLGVIDPMWDESTPSVDALRMCFRCPVIRECAKYGLSRPYASDAGVLGGMGLYDRQRVRSRKVSVRQVWVFRLQEVVAVDWEAAKDEQYARSMPRLALA